MNSFGVENKDINELRDIYQMNERLLTAVEIKTIETESIDPKYQIRNRLHFGRGLTTIMRISSNKGLILFRGNQYTGFEHIDERHSAASKAAFWKFDKKVYLENPSRFSLDITPIFDYLHIAESVYLPNNLVLGERNKRPDLFDLYIGEHTDKKNRTATYKLILYKNSKILHSLFPVEKTFNKEKILNLRQGFTSATIYDKTCIDLYTIPYFDINNVELYKVIVRLDKGHGKERWAIQVNTSEGNPLATYQAFEKNVSSYLMAPFRMASLDYHENMVAIEKTIKQIIDGQIKIE